MGKEGLFDILRNLQEKDDLKAELLVEALQTGGKEGVQELLENLIQSEEFMPDAGETFSLIKELTSDLNQEQRHNLGDFMEQSARQLGCDELSTVFLKLLAELEQE